MASGKSSSRLRSAGSSTHRIRILEQIMANVFSILSLGFGVAALAMLLGSTYAPMGGVSGENLVLIEVQVLPGFYMKPITFFTFAMFLCFAFGLYAPPTRQKFLKAPAGMLRTVYIGAWLVAMGSAFEIAYNLVLWSAALAVQGAINPDIVYNPFPLSANPTPINVVFAAKIVVAIFFMSLFLIDYVRRIDRIRLETALSARLGRRAVTVR
jgi:hypothetical protein